MLNVIGQHNPDEMPALIARHNEILNRAFQTWNGFVLRLIGDSLSPAFNPAFEALNASLEAQRGLNIEEWVPAPIKVRMGINTGAARWIEDSVEIPYEGYATHIDSVNRRISDDKQLYSSRQ